MGTFASTPAISTSAFRGRQNEDNWAALLPVILRNIVEFADAENAGQPAWRDAIVSLCTFGARGRGALRQAVDRPDKN